MNDLIWIQKQMNKKSIKDCWITSFTGRKIYPLDIKSSQIDINDICQSLSMQCRFSGHCFWFYSIAEHCCRVSQLLKDQGYDREIQLAGLCHDFGESCGINDMCAPLKRQPNMKFYRDIEDKIERIIARKYKFPYPYPPPVKEADKILLLTECRDLRRNQKPNIDNGFELLEPLVLPIIPMTQPEAKRQLLDRFYFLQIKQ